MNEQVTKSPPKSQFTEKQMREIYAFLDEFIEEGKKVEAKRIIRSIILHDRALMKSCLNTAWIEMLSKIDKVL